MKFNKILLAKNSPKNKCYAENGEWLIPAQSEHRMEGKLPQDHHFFIGLNSHRPSRYGWVATVDIGLTPEELARKYQTDPTKELIESCELFLNAVKTQKDDTPMACTFSTIGVIEKRRVMKVHRVFFYKLNENGQTVNERGDVGSDGDKGDE